ncbi:MAG: tRNA epoxyqueuosine(34) reductase QueG, partial [Bdellovibrio sp. CG10_big_fil_rev_8_21_14_0_10_47_8]
RSRLGWIGKNTCLIHPKKGSLFLVGEILTSLSIAPTPETMHDFCGTCTRCIDICPTSALEEPRLLNANKCISYLTIESRELPPEAIRPQIKDWFFGCDLCQTVCPWNQKLFGQNLDTRPQRTVDTDSRQELIIELREILTLSGKKLEKKYAHSPLQRAGPFGLRRNAIVVAANQNLVELIPEIREQSRHDKLQDLVDWALSQLKNHRV